jgi:hypothetical protein
MVVKEELPLTKTKEYNMQGSTPFLSSCDKMHGEGDQETSSHFHTFITIVGFI